MHGELDCAVHVFALEPRVLDGQAGGLCLDAAHASPGLGLRDHSQPYNCQVAVTLSRHSLTPLLG